MGQPITRAQLKIIEQYADALFAEHGIDVEFQNLYKGTHFLDRLNDPRNESPVTVEDLKGLFKKVSGKYGDKLGMESPGAQGVLKDMATNVNVPFLLKWDDRNRELDLIPKTIMKKRGFVAKDREYKVEMTLKSLFKTILSEIGDRSAAPKNATYSVHESGGKVHFDFGDDRYIINIELPVKQNNKIAPVISFATDTGEFAMTNRNAALQVMSNIVGGVEVWLSKYKEKYLDGENLIVPYLKFNPKSEDTENWSEDDLNRRDRLYRAYITKFASRYGSTVSFSTTAGINAVFNPNLTI